jgi:Kef-type K+ transport system membrane component KefB
MSSTEIFLLAMLLIFSIPYLIWRLGKTDYYAPLVVVQIMVGILLGPGILGNFSPESYHFIFSSSIIQTLNGIAWWAVMLFVMIAGIELDLEKAWEFRRESSITAGLALGVPLILGSIFAMCMLTTQGWIGEHGLRWQFVLGIGMSCAVTALPILILFLEKLDILRTPLGQRILRYASLDDIAIWGVLALIMLDWTRVSRQIGFLFIFAFVAWAVRKIMQSVSVKDRWYLLLIWLVMCSFAADWAGLHFMVGAFLAGVILDAKWFDQEQMDLLRHHVLLVMMPIFFLSTGLKTNWSIGGISVFVAAAGLLFASVFGKHLGVYFASRLLGWEKGEAGIIAWLLQTKALIMIIFVNILLDKGIITDAAFTSLLLMAIASTMMTVPMVQPKLAKLRELINKVF